MDTPLINLRTKSHITIFFCTCCFNCIGMIFQFSPSSLFQCFRTTVLFSSSKNVSGTTPKLTILFVISIGNIVYLKCGGRKNFFNLIAKLKIFPFLQCLSISSRSGMLSVIFPTFNSTNKEIKNFLKNLEVPYSFPTKQKLMDRVELYKKVAEFSWRKDQSDVIRSFLEQKYKYYVVNGIFGCGKTTMLMGIHIYSILTGLYTPKDAMFISFNISIRNELKQKLKKYGMSPSTEVRTFDSLIYEICKVYEYPHLDLPNFDGKRRFVYSICKRIQSDSAYKKEIPTRIPKYIFIDECQDLESQTFIIFTTFFTDSQIIFTGDVFQSIQKEPKESLLWFLLHDEHPKIDISKHCMKETPRIPPSILTNLKNSLQNYYPEFSNEIEDWKSSSSVSEAKIKWKQFDNYTEIFKHIDRFLDKYPPEKCMILTFSSAITVKGNLGDLARIRRYLCSRGYDMNKNHKRMDHDKLFLSTANSSKGLEREYVLLISTFPLEKAFMCFSDDLVMNLITVGITRAKQVVKFLIPSYLDKFSSSLGNFVNCPKPTKQKIREGSELKDYTFADYYSMEHCATEIIRQGVVKYDTRIKLFQSTKQFNSEKLFEQNIPAPKLETEEERAFVGVLIENLITSSWSNEWPKIRDIEKLRNHPMYHHCFKKIEHLVGKYKKYESRERYITFEGIYLYTQVHLAMYNKIFVDLPFHTQDALQQYWNRLKPQVLKIKPEGDITIQSNLKMPFVTGVCDALCKTTTNRNMEAETNNYDISIWELKASVEQNWKDNALFQAILYALMTGKNRCRLLLLNPFRNEKCSYYFNMKNVMELRQIVIDDVVCWNVNCFLAKNIKCRGNTLKVTDNYFLFMKENPNTLKFEHITLVQFLSPTKLNVIFNMCTTSVSSEQPRSKLTRNEKLRLESTLSEDDALKILYDFLQGPDCKNSKIYYSGDCSLEDNSKFIRFSSLVEELPSQVLQISIPDDSLTQTLSYISTLSVKFKLT